MKKTMILLTILVLTTLFFTGCVDERPPLIVVGSVASSGSGSGSVTINGDFVHHYDDCGGSGSCEINHHYDD